MKHELRVRHYVRYTDDFVVLATQQEELEKLLPIFRGFLYDRLALCLHPKKVTIRKLRQGVDFLGYIILPHYRRLRIKTARRIFRKLQERAMLLQGGVITNQQFEQSLQSYLGVLSHAQAYNLRQDLLNWFGKPV